MNGAGGTDEIWLILSLALGNAGATVFIYTRKEMGVIDRVWAEGGSRRAPLPR